MSKKKTLEELEAEKNRQMEKLKKLDKEIKAMTKAEEAKANSDIIKAVKRWQESLPPEKRTEWKKIPDLFYRWIEKNAEKYPVQKAQKSTVSFDV